MKLSDLKVIYLRPAPRLPKLIALSMIYWQMWRNKMELPAIIMMPEADQPTVEGIYNLDCKGNGYRQRGFISEVDTVLEDFPEIEVRPELDCLADLVESHNVRFTRVGDPGQTHRSTRNVLNQHPGSLGFLTGSAWDIIDHISSYAWKKVIKGQVGAEIKKGPLTQEDFLDLALHMIFMFVEAEKDRREGKAPRWKDGMKVPEIQHLMDTEFQGKKIGGGMGQPLTIAKYIQDLYQTGFTIQQINDLLAPWMTIWLHLERALDEAPNIEPLHWFRIGEGKNNAVVFDFLTKAKGWDNPLVHQGWLNDDDRGRPRANCVIIRRHTGHVAVFTRGVFEDSIKNFGYELINRENGAWVYEGGWVIFNGSKSRPDQKPTQMELATIVAGAEQELKLVPRKPFPSRLYTSRKELATH